jgi:two-component system, NtrC family, sensor kinase
VHALCARTATLVSARIASALAHVIAAAASEREAALRRQLLHSDRLAGLGQLAAGIVHELNNPLTAIVAYADSLGRRARLRGDTDDEERVRRIEESAERMLRFSRDLVAYARPSTSAAAPFDLAVVVSRALGFCDHILRGTGCVVRHDADRRGLGIVGSPHDLAQVFVNLLTNACHAVPSGSGQITVSFRVDDDDRTVAVVIEDNGGGISADYAPKIFDPFFTTKTEGRGTGLGLSIVRNVLDAHGATITLETEAPIGARFVLRFPLAPASGSLTETSET